MNQSPSPKNKLLKHIINNHIVYMIGVLAVTTTALVYADQGIPDFYEHKSALQGNLLEVLAGTYVPPKVLSPNGGESYQMGQTLPIAWDGESETTNLYLLPKMPESEVVMIEKNLEGRVYNWAIPQELEGGLYRVGLKNGHDLDESDGFFTILAKKEEEQKLTSSSPEFRKDSGAAAEKPRQESEIIYSTSNILPMPVVENELQEVNEDKTEEKIESEPSGELKGSQPEKAPEQEEGNKNHDLNTSEFFQPPVWHQEGGHSEKKHHNFESSNHHREFHPH